MKKRSWLSILALMLVFLLLVGCGSTSTNNGDDNSNSGDDNSSQTDENNGSDSQGSDETETPSTDDLYGGSITLYYTSDIDVNFDPTIGDNQGYCLWMETLFAYDVTLSGNGYNLVSGAYDYNYVTGQLASGYDWDPDNAELTVYIRQDVYYQDKEPFNGRQFVASDVKWAYDRALGIGSGFTEPNQATYDWSGELYFVESIECTDDFTVVFHFTEGNEVYLNAFMITAMNVIGPEWDELTDEQKTDVNYACGTGPYMLEEIVAGQSAKLVRNPNYYGTDERAGYEGNQLPYLDEINFVYVSDTTNVVAQFVSGELDFIGGRTNVLNDSEMAQLAATSSGYVQKTFDIGRTEIIMLRCNCEPFNDPNVRQALQYAIDLESIMSDYYGLGLTLRGLYNSFEDYSSEDWYEEVAEGYTYNPDKATALLEAAGYGDGLEFTVAISDDNDKELFTYVNSTYFAPLGINMTLDNYSNFMEVKTIGNTEDETRSTAGTGCVSSGDAKVNLNGPSVYTCTGGWGYAFWHGDDYWDSTVAALKDEVTTIDQYYEYCRGLDEYFLAQHWITYVSGQKEVIEFYSSRLQGLDEGDRLYNPTQMGTLLSYMWVTD